MLIDTSERVNARAEAVFSHKTGTSRSEPCHSLTELKIHSPTRRSMNFSFGETILSINCELFVKK